MRCPLHGRRDAALQGRPPQGQPQTLPSLFVSGNLTRSRWCAAGPHLTARGAGVDEMALAPERRRRPAADEGANASVCATMAAPAAATRAVLAKVIAEREGGGEVGVGASVLHWIL